MSKVFVLDRLYKPVNPVHPARARLLLKQGKASVYRMYPFTIVLTGVLEHPEVKPLRLKLDPGSKTTGIALVNDASGEWILQHYDQHWDHSRRFLSSLPDTSPKRWLCVHERRGGVSSRRLKADGSPRRNDYDEYSRLFRSLSIKNSLFLRITVGWS